MKGLSSPPYSRWKKVYETTLTANAASLTISGLDGNKDKCYLLIARFYNDAGAGAVYYMLRLNNDSSANYGYQRIQGAAAAASAAQATAQSEILLGECSANAQKMLVECRLFARTGQIRLGILHSLSQVSGTTIPIFRSNGAVWNNSADNITSLVLSGTTGGTMGVGSTIELWAMR